MLGPTVFLLLILAQFYTSFKKHNAFLGIRAPSVNPPKTPSLLVLCDQVTVATQQKLLRENTKTFKLMSTSAQKEESGQDCCAGFSSHGLAPEDIYYVMQCKGSFGGSSKQHKPCCSL